MLLPSNGCSSSCIELSQSASHKDTFTFLGSIYEIKVENTTRFRVFDLVCIPEFRGEVRLLSG